MHRFYADGLGEIGSLVTLSEELSLIHISEPTRH